MEYFVKQVKVHYNDEDILHKITREQSDFLKEDMLLDIRLTENTITEIQKLTSIMIEQIKHSEETRISFIEKLDKIKN